MSVVWPPVHPSRSDPCHPPTIPDSDHSPGPKDGLNSDGRNSDLLESISRNVCLNKSSYCISRSGHLSTNNVWYVHFVNSTF